MPEKKCMWRYKKSSNVAEIWFALYQLLGESDKKLLVFYINKGLNSKSGANSIGLN